MFNRKLGSPKHDINNNDQYKLLINKIIDHRLHDDCLEYKVIYRDGSTNRKKWLSEKNLINCNEMISAYRYQNNLSDKTTDVQMSVNKVKKTKSNNYQKKRIL